MIFDGDGQAFSKSPKQQFCNVFAISKKKLRDEADFFHANGHQSFLQDDTTIIGGHDQAFSKFSK